MGSFKMWKSPVPVLATVYKSYHRCVSTRTCKLMRSSLSQSMLVYRWSISAAVSAQHIFISVRYKAKQYHDYSMFFKVQSYHKVKSYHKVYRRFSNYLHFPSTACICERPAHHKSLCNSCIDESYSCFTPTWIHLELLFFCCSRRLRRWDSTLHGRGSTWMSCTHFWHHVASCNCYILQ